MNDPKPCARCGVGERIPGISYCRPCKGILSPGGHKKDARRLEKLYDTKARGTTHTTVLRLIRERGIEGAIAQLEAWGMRPVMDVSCPK